MTALNEEALKEFIDQLPDLGKKHEASGLGEEERLYITGVLDAYATLTGEREARAVGKALIEHARKFRVPHKPVWIPLSGGAPYCEICEVQQDEGEVPWHIA